MSPVHSKTPRTVRLRPVRRLKDAQVFIQSRTRDTHQFTCSPATVLKRLTAPGVLAFIVDDGAGRSLGTCSITETEPSIGVAGIALLPEFRQQGYGTAVLRQLERKAAGKGFIALRADIFDDNAKAMALFEKSGYRKYSLFEKPL